MIWGATISDWDDDWSYYLGRGEVLGTGITYALLAGISYYLFVTHWSYALLYYDEVL